MSVVKVELPKVLATFATSLCSATEITEDTEWLVEIFPGGLCDLCGTNPIASFRGYGGFLFR